MHQNFKLDLENVNVFSVDVTYLINGHLLNFQDFFMPIY